MDTFTGLIADVGAGNLTAGGLLLFAVLAVLSGRIQPKSTVDQIRADAAAQIDRLERRDEEMRDRLRTKETIIDALLKTTENNAASITAMTEHGKTTDAFMKALSMQRWGHDLQQSPTPPQDGGTS